MAGVRSRKVTFFRPASGARDSAGFPVAGAPVKLGVSFADLRELSDVEKVKAGREASERVARVIVRSNPVTRALEAGALIDAGGGELWTITGNIPAPKSPRMSRELMATRAGRLD